MNATVDLAGVKERFARSRHQRGSESAPDAMTEAAVIAPLLAPTAHSRETRDQLADLARRMENAERIAADALEAGNTDKAVRAMRRYFLRVAQHSWLSQRPANALCPVCEWGHTDWPAGRLLGEERPIRFCLDDAEDMLARQAEEQLGVWADG